MPEIKLGTKFGCFSCGTKFYDLGKSEAICPKCGANQKDSVRAEAPAQGRPRPPMAGRGSVVPAMRLTSSRAKSMEERRPRR